MKAITGEKERARIQALPTDGRSADAACADDHVRERGSEASDYLGGHRHGKRDLHNWGATVENSLGREQGVFGGTDADRSDDACVLDPASHFLLFHRSRSHGNFVVRRAHRSSAGRF
jgi:hypothetical protein